MSKRELIYWSQVLQPFFLTRKIQIKKLIKYRLQFMPCLWLYENNRAFNMQSKLSPFLYIDS